MGGPHVREAGFGHPPVDAGAHGLLDAAQQPAQGPSLQGDVGRLHSRVALTLDSLPVHIRQVICLIGESGMPGPIIIIDKGAQRPLNVVSEHLTVLASGDHTGSYEVFHQEGAEGSGPPPHKHPWDEAFYVIRGEVAFGAGDQESVARAGTFVHVPGGTTHWFRFGTGGGEYCSHSGLLPGAAAEDVHRVRSRDRARQAGSSPTAGGDRWPPRRRDRRSSRALNRGGEQRDSNPRYSSSCKHAFPSVRLRTSSATSPPRKSAPWLVCGRWRVPLAGPSRLPLREGAQYTDERPWDKRALRRAHVRPARALRGPFSSASWRTGGSTPSSRPRMSRTRRATNWRPLLGAVEQQEHRRPPLRRSWPRGRAARPPRRGAK